MYTRVSDTIVLIDGIEYRKRKKMPDELAKTKRKLYMRLYRERKKYEMSSLKFLIEDLKKEKNI